MAVLQTPLMVAFMPGQSPPDVKIPILRIIQFQVMEEDAVEVIVIILAGMRQNGIKILAALLDDRRQTDDLRTGTHDDQQL